VKSTQKQPNCKKGAAHAKIKAAWKKLWNQRWWLRWSDSGKIFNSNNSSEFWCQFPVGGGNTNLPESLLLKFLPLLRDQSILLFSLSYFSFQQFFISLPIMLKICFHTKILLIKNYFACKKYNRNHKIQ